MVAPTPSTAGCIPWHCLAVRHADIVCTRNDVINHSACCCELLFGQNVCRHKQFGTSACNLSLTCTLDFQRMRHPCRFACTGTESMLRTACSTLTKEKTTAFGINLMSLVQYSMYCTSLSRCGIITMFIHVKTRPLCSKRM